MVRGMSNSLARPWMVAFPSLLSMAAWTASTVPSDPTDLDLFFGGSIGDPLLMVRLGVLLAVFKALEILVGFLPWA